MHPQTSRLRRANGLHLTHPDIRFALVSLAPPVALFSLGSGNAHKRFLSHAPQHLSGLRAHGQHRLHEKSPSTFVADVSHAADLATMGQINVTAYLAPTAPRERTGLVLSSGAGAAASGPHR
jgi:hypothetical protein